MKKSSKKIPWYKTRKGKALVKRLNDPKVNNPTRKERMAAARRLLAYLEKAPAIYDDGSNDKKDWHDHLVRKYT